MRNAARILIAEDHHDTARLLVLALELEGLRATVAENGAAALHQARKRVPDLVLLDVDMPVMSGLDVLRNIRDDVLLAKVPVIMVTAAARPEDVQRAMELGADDYVTKPFDTFHVTERVQSLLTMDPDRRAGRREAVLLQLDLSAAQNA